MMNRIQSIEAWPLNVQLKAPFQIANGGLERVSNAVVRIELESGHSGYGEIPVLPPVTKLSQSEALNLIRDNGPMVTGLSLDGWGKSLRTVSESLQPWPSLRSGVEQAVLDAYGQWQNRAMWSYFGSSRCAINTDITIPICSLEESVTLVQRYVKQGFQIIKTKVGRDYDEDIRRLVAMQGCARGVSFIIDANEGFSSKSAIQFSRELKRRAVQVSLFEQPVPREDWDGMTQVTREAAIPIAADESCQSLEDAKKLHRMRGCDVYNLKLAKVGIAGALEISDFARKVGIGLMVGAMVETRLGLATAAHLATGLGGFSYIDLDTACLMKDDPVSGGPRAIGSRFVFDEHTVGHGARVRSLALEQADRGGE